MSISAADKNTFGAAAKLHPITQRPLENGIGAMPEDVQAANHCDAIEREGDKKTADEMRKKLGIATREEVAAKDAEKANHLKKVASIADELRSRVSALEENKKEHAEMHARIEALEAKVAALESKEVDHSRIAALEEAFAEHVAKIQAERSEQSHG